MGFGRCSRSHLYDFFLCPTHHDLEYDVRQDIQGQAHHVLDQGPTGLEYFMGLLILHLQSKCRYILHSQSMITSSPIRAHQIVTFFGQVIMLPLGLITELSLKIDD